MPASPIHLAGSSRAQAWTAYWQSGVLHSLPGSFEGNYAGPIGLRWRSFLAGLQGPCHVLDLATGNGPLPACLLEVNAQDNVTCTGVDLASVAPAWWLTAPAQSRERVQFKGGVDLGHLPFAAGQFDAVVSQFGFEYGPRPDSAQELVRVLRVHGQMQLVCHHRDSFLLSQARHERAHLHWLLSADGWLQAAEAMLEPMSLAGHPQGQMMLARDSRYQSIRTYFDQWAQAAQERVQTLPCADVLGEVGQALAHCFQKAMSDGKEAGLVHLSELRCQLELADQRLLHMQAAALEPNEVSAMLDWFAQHRLQLEVGLLEDENGLWAWTLSGKKMGA